MLMMRLATAVILTAASFIDLVMSAVTLDRWHDAAVRAIMQGIEKFLLS